MDWYILSLIALICYGVQNFLYKVCAEKRCNSARVTFSFMLTVLILSTIFFLIFEGAIKNWTYLIIVALISSTSFLGSIISRIEALKHIPAIVAYPIMRLSMIIVVLFSVFYFKDSLSIFQIAGIILAFFVLLLLIKKEAKEKVDKKFGLGIILVIVALTTSAIASIIQKFAVVVVDKFGYIAVSYALSTLFSYALRNKMQSSKENPKQKNAYLIGIIIGIFNFVGFYTLLNAFSIGPLSLVAAINSMSFVIAIILSILIYKEKITTKRMLGVALCIVAIVLLGL